LTADGKILYKRRTVGDDTEKGTKQIAGWEKLRELGKSSGGKKEGANGEVAARRKTSGRKQNNSGRGNEGKKEFNPTTIQENAADPPRVPASEGGSSWQKKSTLVAGETEVKGGR